MNFVFNLAWREVRSSWRRLLFFFVCIGIGVGSIVALRSVISNLNRAVTAEARFLLTGDVEVSSTAPFSESERAAIERALQNAGGAEARDESIQTTTMSRPADDNKIGSTMLELKGIEPQFPLVGEFRLPDGKQFDYALVENRGAVVAPLLLERLALKIGDKIRIGNADFEIRGTFSDEPGGTAGFRLGPRVFIERQAFEAAGLTSFGSRNRYRLLFRTNGAPENLVGELRAELKSVNSIATVRSYKESQENVAQSFDRAENYLSLAGLVILVLGGIGVWNVVRVFVEQKRHSIAVLKCIGATSWKVFAALLLQITALGVVASLFGTALAQIALWLIERNFKEDLPAAMSYALQPAAIFQGVLLGLLVSLLFALLPLLSIRNIKPRLLLRDESSTTSRIFNFLMSGVVLLGLLLLAVWQSGSWRVGTFFLVGLLITSAFLYGAAFLLTFFLRGFRRVNSFALRQAIGSLYRPGNQTRVILLAVGLGVFVILAVQSLQANLLREFDFLRGNSLPSLFLIDIQRSQADEIKQTIEAATSEKIELIPAVRSRIAAIDGKSMSQQQGEMQQQRGQIGREYVLTYRQKLVGEEEILAGKFWDETPAAEPEISVDQSMKGLMGLDVGSTVTFDILGQKLDAKVTSIRRIDGRNPRSTFLILFRPGSQIESAPQTLLAPVFAQLEAADRARLQRTLVDKFPNVSVIDTNDAVTAIKRLINNLTLGVSFVGGFVFLSGVLILIGSIALTKFQRIYENAILKTLGARRKTLLAILLAEYAVLGFAAGLIGALASIALSYAVAKYVLEIRWQFEINLILTGLIVTILLVMLVGAISSVDVLLRKPLAILRSQ